MSTQGKNLEARGIKAFPKITAKRRENLRHSIWGLTAVDYGKNVPLRTGTQVVCTLGGKIAEITCRGGVTTKIIGSHKLRKQKKDRLTGSGNLNWKKRVGREVKINNADGTRERKKTRNVVWAAYGGMGGP